MRNIFTILLFIFINPLFNSIFAQNDYSWRNDQNPPNNASWNNTSPYYWWKSTGGGSAENPGGSEVLKFDGDKGTTMDNTSCPSLNRYRMEFYATYSATARTINGTAVFTFYDFSNNIPAIFNNSALTHTINFPILIGNNSTSTSPNYGFEINAYSGNFNIGSTISAANNTGTKILVLMSYFSVASGTSAIDVSGVISNGSGTVGLLKKDINTATLTAQNTYTGSTTINGGILRLNRSGGSTISASSAVTVNSGATLRISSNQTINNLTIASGGTLLIDAGVTLTIPSGASFSCSGTLTNNGTIVIENAMSFPGASATITSGFNNLEIKANTTLNKELTLDGTLSLTSGLLDLGTNNLILNNAATCSGSFSNTNMIVLSSSGKVRKLTNATGSFTFPIGENTGTTEYSPISLDFTSGTFGSGAYTEVSLSDAKHGSNTSTTDFISRYWDVTQSNITSFSCNVSMVYLDADIVGTEANLYCGKFSSGSWLLGSATNTSSNTLTFNAATGFSSFTAGEQAALPVSLLNLKARQLDKINVISWQTASEQNASHFDIERKRNDGTYEYLGTVNASGNSDVLKSYEFIDNKPNSNINTYKLKQVDFNAAYTYYGPVVVKSNYDVIQVLPNPFKDQIIINTISNLESVITNIKIIDLLGKEVYSSAINNNSIEISTSNWAKGVYFIQYTDDISSHQFKIIKD